MGIRIVLTGPKHPMIRFDNVSKRYPSGYEALTRISFQLPRGQLSYLTGETPTPGLRPGRECLAGATGFEPATSGLTGRRELQTSPRPRVVPPGEFESPLPP